MGVFVPTLLFVDYAPTARVSVFDQEIYGNNTFDFEILNLERHLNQMISRKSLKIFYNFHLIDSWADSVSKLQCL